MILLENIKRIAEKATGWRRPDDPQALLRERKPQTYQFTDDGVIPNHPRWPFVVYRSAVRLPESLDLGLFVFAKRRDRSQHVPP